MSPALGTTTPGQMRCSRQPSCRQGSALLHPRFSIPQFSSPCPSTAPDQDQVLNPTKPQKQKLPGTSHSTATTPATLSTPQHPACVTSRRQVPVIYQGQSNRDTNRGHHHQGQQQAALTQYYRHEVLPYLSLAHTPQQTLFCLQPFQF